MTSKKQNIEKVLSSLTEPSKSRASFKEREISIMNINPPINLRHPIEEDLKILKNWGPMKTKNKIPSQDLVPSEFCNITPPHLGSLGKPLTPEQKKENQEALKTLSELFKADLSD